MELDNLQIGQKLYSAINGEVIFDGYIENPQGEKYLICCRKDKQLHYYFLNGKFNEEGMVVLFTEYQKVTKGTTTEELVNHDYNTQIMTSAGAGKLAPSVEADTYDYLNQ